jgi:hypothetical protein
MFPVYDGKWLSRKAVHNEDEKLGKCFADDEEVETEVLKCLRQQSEDFYARGFDALVKQWDKCISVDGGYVEKYTFFSKFEYHMFYVLYPCDLLTDSPSYIMSGPNCWPSHRDLK